MRPCVLEGEMLEIVALFLSSPYDAGRGRA